MLRVSHFRDVAECRAFRLGINRTYGVGFDIACRFMLVVTLRRSDPHCLCSLCAYTDTVLVPGAALGGATNEGTHMDPVHKLLEKDEHREAALRALGDAHHALDEAIAVYRTAFKAATSIGWPKSDLTKAGFPDPTRLPKASLRSSDAEA